MSLIVRRNLLKLGIGAMASASLIAAPAFARAADIASTKAPTGGLRCVAMDNLHTGETMEAVYWEQGDYIPDVLDAVNAHLRDFRTGDVHPIDTRLLDLLDQISDRVQTKARFQVISGFRSQATNAMLHEQSAEVAKKSLHTQGMAIDVRLPDVALEHLHNAALSICAGGVGFYPESNFVHLDVGPVRTWRGS
jgi:uncharacterized protein YcbK (DUF882 family)